MTFRYLPGNDSALADFGYDLPHFLAHIDTARAVAGAGTHRLASGHTVSGINGIHAIHGLGICLLYTSDAADDLGAV